MPVILENGSDQIRKWLDPRHSEWSQDLQSLLRPFQGELECYPVSKEVGKVGNNSPAFIIPVASSENKNNIANFFNNPKKLAKSDEEKKEIKKEEREIKEEGSAIKHDEHETRTTIGHGSTEDDAPLPVPASGSVTQGVKRQQSTDPCEVGPALKTAKQEAPPTPKRPTPNKKTRSATGNGTMKKRPMKSDGSQKITNFLK